MPGLRSAGHIHHQNRGTPVRLAATEGTILKKKYNIVLDEAAVKPARRSVKYNTGLKDTPKGQKSICEVVKVDRDVGKIGCRV